jgi:DNA polymerase-3 subunit epsilon
MLKNIRLTRPLAILDLETTGTDAKEARIVEISILKLYPDGSRDLRTRRVNPGVPIPPEATAVHGITDADVADAPPFSRIAAGVVEFLDGCDLCGFNVKRYDLRVLSAELKRSGRTLPLIGRFLVDPLQIFHDRERRDLAAALKFYCGKTHDGAHGAEADVLATLEILDAQVERYEDLPRTIEGLHAHLSDSDALDFEGNFTRDGAGRIVFNFGKYKGRTLDEIARDPRRADYLTWILDQDFFDDSKAIVREAIGATGLVRERVGS